MKEGTNITIQCQDQPSSKELLSNWSMVDPYTSTNTKFLYTLSSKQDEADNRFSLKENNLRIENVSLSDEGYYQGTLIDQEAGEVDLKCTTQLIVYSKFNMCQKMKCS